MVKSAQRRLPGSGATKVPCLRHNASAETCCWAACENTVRQIFDRNDVRYNTCPARRLNLTVWRPTAAGGGGQQEGDTVAAPDVAGGFRCGRNGSGDGPNQAPTGGQVPMAKWDRLAIRSGREAKVAPRPVPGPQLRLDEWRKALYAKVTGVNGSRWAPRSSKPLWGAGSVPGRFDSDALPPYSAISSQKARASRR